MYNYFDTNNQELKTIEPEYTAMFNADKKEITFFYNNMIDSSAACSTLEEAEIAFDSWCESEIA